MGGDNVIETPEQMRRSLAESPWGRYTKWLLGAAGWIAWAAAVLAVLGLAVPWRPSFLSSAELDASWQYVLAWGYASGAVFGRDLVFTYGPWGFAVHDLYYPGTFAALIVARVVLALGAAAAWWVVGRRLGVPAVLTAATLVAATAVAFMSEPYDPFYLALPVLAALLNITWARGDKWWQRFDSAGVAFAFFVLGLASLMKFSTTLSAAAVLGVCALADLLGRRRVPWAAIAFVVGVPVWWLAAGQPLGGIATFFANAWEVARGYDAAMSSPSPDWIMFPLFFATAGLAMIPAIRAWWNAPGHKAAATVIAASCLLVTLMTFKASFGRHDHGHESLGTRTLLVLALLMWTVAWAAPATGDGWRATLRLWLRRTTPAAAVLLAVWCVHLTQLRLDASKYTVWGLLSKQTDKAVDRITYIPSVLTGRTRFQDPYRDAREAIERQVPFPEAADLKTSVDLYAVNQGRLVTGGYDYRPRPVMQSYSAYTGRLQELNAEHLRSPRAADMLALSTFWVDMRYPTMDDALSWPELLTRYDPERFVTDELMRRAPLLMLRKAATPRSYTLEPIRKITTRWGEPIEVPAATDGPVWATIKLEQTRLGKAAGTLFKPPMVNLAVRDATGAGGQYRLIPSVAARGFWLSPTVTDVSGWMSMWRDRRERSSPQRGELKLMQLALQPGENADIWYDPEITIEFSRLKYETRPASALAQALPWGLLDLAAGEVPMIQGRPPVQIVTEAGRSVLLAAAPRDLRIPLPTDGRRTLSFTAGIRSGSGGPNRVRFVVAAAQGNQGSVIWEQILDPGPAGSIARGTVVIPGGATEVVFQTQTADPATAPPSYWSDVVWR